MKNVTIEWDGSTMQWAVPTGTTAHQVTQNEAVRARLGIPANATPLVNGAESNLPLMEGDRISFISAPSKKA